MYVSIVSTSQYTKCTHSNHVTSNKRVDTHMHTTMRMNSINFLHNLGHNTVWWLEVFPVVYARVYQVNINYSKTKCAKQLTNVFLFSSHIWQMFVSNV